MVTQLRHDLTQPTIQRLMQLTRMNIDSAKCLREAALEAPDAELSSLFHRLARRRDEQVRDLQSYVEEAGERISEQESMFNAIHRTWMKLRSALSGDGSYAMLAEAQAGEAQVEQAYANALDYYPGSAVNDMLHRHLEQVKESHQEIRSVRLRRR